MAINLISPGIKITEQDQVATIPAAGASVGAVVGMHRWGPVEKATLVTSETELVSQFGAPNATNAVDFLTGANYLSYAGALYVSRANTSGLLNATAEATTGSGTAGTGLLVKNDDVYDNTYADGSGNVGPWIAKYAGALGNSLKVSTCPSSAAWESTLTGTFTVAAGSTTVVGTGSAANTEITVGDLLVISGRTLKVASVTNTTHLTLESAHLTGATGATVTRRWEFFDSFDLAPGTSTYTSNAGGVNDEIHIIVVDEDGGISGTAGTILEVFDSASKAADAKTPQGDSNYYVDVLYNKSKYVYWMDHNSSGSNWGSNAQG